MIISKINLAKTNYNQVKSSPKSSSEVNIISTLSVSTGVVSIPYSMPIINFTGKNKSEVNFKGQEIKNIPSNIPVDITNKGYKFYRNVNLQDKEGNPKDGYSFMNKGVVNYDDGTSRTIIEILITDKEFDDLGRLHFQTDKDEYGRKYIHGNVNNYANVYKESNCDENSPIKHYGGSVKTSTGRKDIKIDPNKQYKRVGTELYNVLEEYIKENEPDVEYMEVCPVRIGSEKFHQKIGFKYDRTETYEVYNGWDDSDVRSYVYYRKYLKPQDPNLKSKYLLYDDDD